MIGEGGGVVKGGLKYNSLIQKLRVQKIRAYRNAAYMATFSLGSKIQLNATTDQAFLDRKSKLKA